MGDTTPPELKRYQQSALDFALKKKKVLISLRPGAGKTAIAQALASTVSLKLEEKIFVVFSRNLFSEMEKKLKNLYTVLYVSLEEELTIEKLNALNDAKLIVVDECHLLADYKGDLVKFMTVLARGDRLVHMSGTIFGDKTQSFTIPVATVMHPNIFPISDDKFLSRYYYTPMYKKVMTGWFLNSLTFRIGGILVLSKFLETADFMNTFNKPYFARKKKIVEYITKLLPFFDRKVLEIEEGFVDYMKDLTIRKRIVSFLSMMAYSTLMQPFSFLFPLLLYHIHMTANRGLKTLDRKLIGKDLKDNMFVEPKDISTQIQTATFSDIKTIKVDLDENQMQLLIRMVHGRERVTETELRMIKPDDLYQTPGSIENSWAQDIDRLNVDMDWIKIHGPVLSNLTFTDGEIEKIEKERGDITAKHRPLISLVEEVSQGGEGRTAVVVPQYAYSPCPKFLKIQKLLTQKIIGKDKLRVMIFTDYLDRKDIIDAQLMPALQKIPVFNEENVKKFVSGQDSLKENYNDSAYGIMIFPQKDMEGIDGFKETDIVIFLEPVRLTSTLVQLKGRAIRLGSHNDSSKKVELYEFVSVVPLAPIKRTLQEVKEWFQMDAGTMFFSRKKWIDFKTPDEFRIQDRVTATKRHRSIEEAILEAQEKEDKTNKPRSKL